MSGRSVADIVADLRDGDIIDRGSGPVRSVALVDIEAADLLERLDALRPTCPTCDGKGVVVTPDTVGRAFFAVLDEGKGAGVQHLVCPDCTEGRMSWERMAAIVARVFLVKEPSNHGGEYGDGWRACIDRLRSVRP